MIICPACRATDCRRSRRRSLRDYAAAFVGSLPWRCRRCERRFRSRIAPVSSLFFAQCSICGNPELKRIAPQHVTGIFAPLWRFLGVPAYRCMPCRHKFFSLRPPSEPAEDEKLKMAS